MREDRTKENKMVVVVVARQVPIRIEKKEKRKKERMRVGRMVRFDQSGHDLSHTEVRVYRATTKMKKKVSNEEEGQ